MIQCAPDWKWKLKSNMKLEESKNQRLLVIQFEKKLREYIYFWEFPLKDRISIWEIRNSKLFYILYI